MRVHPFGEQLDLIRGQAESCSKQIGAWMMSIERLPIKGKRHLTPQTYQQRDQEIENGRNGARRRPGGARRPAKIKGH
jgi:hypothetical protein